PVARTAEPGTGVSRRTAADVRDRPGAARTSVSVRFLRPAGVARGARGFRNGRVLLSVEGARLWGRRRAGRHLRVRQRVSRRRRTAESARRHRRVRHRAGEEVSPRSMQSHLLLLILFAFFVSLVFAAIAKDDVKEQIRYGG